MFMFISARLKGKPDIAVVLVLTALATVAVVAKLLQYYGFLIHDWDTGIYSNVVWNLANGNWFHSDVLNRNDLGEHFSPIIIVFVPFFMAYPSPVWLVAGQGLAVGTTYFLLYFIALKIFCDANTKFAKPLALGFAIWAFFYRPLTSALLSEFHPSTFATPLLAAAILALLHRRDRILWLLVAILLLAKENAPLAVLGLGCYAGLVLLRSRLGMALGIVAGVSAALILGLVMPHFRNGEWSHYGRLAPFAEWTRKSHYLFMLVKGLAFLPLAGWRGLLCAAPLLALNLSVKFAPQFSSNFHYDDFISVFLLVSAMHGTVILFRGVDNVFKSWRAVVAFAVVALVAIILVDPEASDALSYVQNTWPGANERQLRRELSVYSRLPGNVGIAAQQSLGPYLSARPRYVAIHPAAQAFNILRLKAGDKVLITPVGNEWEEFADLKRLFDNSPRLVRVHASPVLRVYEVKR